MSEDDFYQTTPRAFQNKIKGFERYEENLYKERWEMHRELIVTVLSPHLDKKHKNKSMHELYPLAWDKAKLKRLKKLSPTELWSKIDEAKKNKNSKI
jgi:hypothetical protein